MKKHLAVLCILTLCITAFLQTSETESIFSPAYYRNLFNKSYENMLWLKNKMWYTYNKLSEPQKFDEKWQATFPRKEKNETPGIVKTIANPEYAAQKFKVSVRKNLPYRSDIPDGFFFGASSSHYQVEGDLDKLNANAIFYAQNDLTTAGEAINFWENYKQDIKQMKEELGITMFRFSIAWERVKKSLDGEYDQAALDIYKDIAKTLKDNGIEPFVCLHHYTVPEWFKKIGGFEKEENLKYFVEFAEKMYETLAEDVTYWSTFNSIEGHAFKGYFKGEAPPGEIGKMQLTQKVMANMLEAHVRVYQTIHAAYEEKVKTNPKLPEPKVGIQKNIIPLDPIKKENIGIRSASAITSVMGEILQNQGFFSFFTTNTYSIYVPFYVSYSHTNPNASKSLDWIGVNIYSNMEMRLAAQQNEVDEDKQTANTNYRDYPEGIYRAVTEIKEISDACKVPIIITENGIATKDDNSGDIKRTRFFRRTLYVIRKLLDEHYPIIGYLPWSAHDNYEWPIKKDGQWLNEDPFTSRRYGFFRVEFDKNSDKYLKRTLKKGSEYYRDFIRSFKTGSYPETPSWKE